MANYYGKSRTNYFMVTDVEKFKNIMSNLTGEDEVEFYEHDIEKGKFMFCCDCNLTGYIEDEENEEACDNAFDNMIEKLQDILPDGETIILTEVGNEKMRYLLGLVTIITRTQVKTISLHDVALDKAREMINNPEYCTQIDY